MREAASLDLSAALDQRVAQHVRQVQALGGHAHAAAGQPADLPGHDAHPAGGLHFRPQRTQSLPVDLTGGPQRVDALEGLRQQFGHLAADLGDR